MKRSKGELRAQGRRDAAQEASSRDSRRPRSHGRGMVVAPQNASGRLADTTLVVGATVVREEAQKARTQAREAVMLLEEARTLLAKGDALLVSLP